MISVDNRVRMTLTKELAGPYMHPVSPANWA